ncbi:MAG TPA: TNT domain-containing protein, partial [Pseudonocardiaceae bacterium]
GTPGGVTPGAPAPGPAPGSGQSGTVSPGTGQSGAVTPGQPSGADKGTGLPADRNTGLPADKGGERSAGLQADKGSGAPADKGADKSAQPAADKGDKGTAAPPAEGRRTASPGVPLPLPAQPYGQQPGGAPAAPLDLDNDKNAQQAVDKKPRLGPMGALFGGLAVDSGAMDRDTRGDGGGEAGDPLSAFLLLLFPDGRRPEPGILPVRQVVPPPPELDLAAGLRFPPGDHPQAHLVDAAGPCDADPAEDPERPAPSGVTAGYDPLGGQHERDWERRFVVRAAGEETHAEYAWPPAEVFPEGGCAPEAVEAMVLEPGTALDRFGAPDGRVLSADGTPFAARSLPPEYLGHGYHRYRVERPLPVWRTVSAPWFGQPGGAVRYRATHPVRDLLATGHLSVVPAGPEPTTTTPAPAAGTAVPAPADGTADPATTTDGARQAPELAAAAAGGEERA